tara:strand:- start:591 stop:1019 length:429 start_codon:yes stop_codon:yes gene_type:complete
MTEKKKDVEEVKPPSLIQMIKNFGKEYKKWAKEGHPTLSAADYTERLTACKACPHLIADKMRCGKCGCMVEHKAKWRTTTCPDDPQRWKSQDPNPKTRAEAALREQQRKAAEDDAAGKMDRPPGPRKNPDERGVEYTDFEDV